MEYQKRLGRFCDLSIEEIKEELVSDNPSPAQEEYVKNEEGKRILGRLKQGAYVISLDIKGKEYSSEGLAAVVSGLGLKGKSDVAFIIGGSIGLGSNVLEQSDLRLSFSKMTFPHQMMRVILLEQLYRSFKINKNEPYHK
ncbi:23S rRNA (pseudouridine(1915)-N(3))-methyltransferase RlmH [Bacillota bacterium]